MTELRVNDIFESISGEAGGFPQGTWCTFIRLQGCNLACRWCDTPQAQDKNAGCPMSVLDILSLVHLYHNEHILITGGEPLLQPQVEELITNLLENGYEVQVETNGSFIIPPILQVHWVVDHKGPSSGMMEKMIPFSSLASSFAYHLLSLQEGQASTRSGSIWVKHVVKDDSDLINAIEFMNSMLDYHLQQVPQIISPVDADGSMITRIVGKITELSPNLLNQIIFSVQLHKLFNLP